MTETTGPGNGAFSIDSLPAPLDAAFASAVALRGECQAMALLCKALGVSDTPTWSREMEREVKRAVDAGGAWWVAMHLTSMVTPAKQKNERKR